MKGAGKREKRHRLVKKKLSIRFGIANLLAKAVVKNPLFSLFWPFCGDTS